MEHYFYKKEINYGSEKAFGPISAFLNGSYDILRNNNDKRSVFLFDYKKATTNVNKNLANSYDLIKENPAVFKSQLFPTEFNLVSSTWVPNYQTHLIGEGMVCRKLAEWYDSHGYPAPYLLAVLNTFGYQYMNEVVENGDHQGNNIDPVPDIFIFNPLGWLLFAFDPVSDFFSQKLHMAYWGQQPSLNPFNGRMSNAGEEFIIKVDLPITDKYQFFYSWGIDGIVGLSYKDDLNYSFGYGLKADYLKESIVNNQRSITPEMLPEFAFYLDKNESLLLSVTQTGIENINLTINAYPNLFERLDFGFYLSYKSYLGLHLGVNWNFVPLGLFYGK